MDGREEEGREWGLTFDCGIVFVNKVGLDELDGQTRLSHAASADNDELVLAQKLPAVSLGFMPHGHGPVVIWGAPWKPFRSCAEVT